jgi:hypothetical protein
MYPAATGGGEQAKVTPFAWLARGSWQDARSLVNLDVVYRRHGIN